jgi:diguanylate cyclase (GGDEF)-like protein
MSFEPATLIILMVVIAATVGTLLVFAWVQNRSHRELAMWGGVDIAGALVTALIATRNHAPDFVSITLPFGLLAAAYAVMWAAGRTFSNRPLLSMWMAAGPVIWFVACAFPVFFQFTQYRVVLISVISATYTFAAAYELWRGRDERLLSRFPMIGCLVLHASFLVARAAVALVWTPPTGAQILTTSWVAAMVIEAIVLIIAGGFLQLSMAKERSEQVQRRAAATDELTGVASRRAFLDEGEQRLKAAMRQGLPVALLLFDLDRFKQINDSHGHQAGDRVLQAFAGRAVEVLRPGDFFGRIGGEEFAALLSNTNQASALRIAEHVRAAVEKLEFWEHDVPLHLSVSGGVATASNPGCDLASLLKQADHALYGAKTAGRNCVQLYKPRAAALLRIV